MAIGDIIVGIDIGTTKVCTVVGEVNNFGMKVLASIVIVTLVIVPMLIYRLGKGLNGDV